MKRLARHLFTFWSTLSLLLFALVCVLWLRQGNNGTEGNNGRE